MDQRLTAADAQSALALLLALARFGLADDEFGYHCIGCMFSAESFTAPVVHDADCPILLAQQWLDAHGVAWREE